MPTQTTFRRTNRPTVLARPWSIRGTHEGASGCALPVPGYGKILPSGSANAATLSPLESPPL